jgi:hypothetical protein
MRKLRPPTLSWADIQPLTAYAESSCRPGIGGTATAHRRLIVYMGPDQIHKFNPREEHQGGRQHTMGAKTEAFNSKEPGKVGAQPTRSAPARQHLPS